MIGQAALYGLGGDIGFATGGAASLLSMLTFDRRYIKRQFRIRREKNIRTFGEGVLEAGRSLAEGVEGLFDVVRQPIRGAKENCVKGFVAGIGQGVAGTVIKPISKVG